MEFTFILSLYTLIFVIKWRVGEVIHVVFKGHPQRLVFGILILTVESHRENLEIHLLEDGFIPLSL